MRTPMIHGKSYALPTLSPDREHDHVPEFVRVVASTSLVLLPRMADWNIMQELGGGGAKEVIARPVSERSP